MATKNNIRSIRFTDEMADLIDRQEGKNFQQKFENLVTRCAFELPQREKELERLAEKKAHALEELWELEHKVLCLKNSFAEMQGKTAILLAAINRSIEKFEEA